MATGYTRNDTTNNIANGNIIDASDLDGEFDAIQAAYDATTGHAHDGTVGGGAPIGVLGPTQDIVVTNTVLRPKTDNTVDLGSNTLEFKDLWIDGTANIDSLVADTADINGGTIDGVTIGGASAGAVTTTSLVATTADINGGTIDGATIATSDITVGAGKTLNVSAGTLTLANDQISGDKVEGGTINAITINTLGSTTGNITNVNATTIDTTNLEVTAIKAKDGTTAATIADSTGVVTVPSSVLTTTDINGGTIDGATIATSDITVGSGKTLNVSAGTLTLADNQISGDKVEGGTINAITINTLGSTTGNITNVNATTVDTTNLEVTAIKAKDGTASATIANSTGIMTVASSVLTTADINGGTIDNTTIGGSSAAAGTFTNVTATGTVNLSGATVSNGGSVTTVDINGGTIDGVTIGGASAGAITGTTITATGDVTIPDKIIHAGDTDTSIRFPAADTVTVETNGAERLRVTSTGNVGIGTSSPATILDVSGVFPTLTLKDSRTSATWSAGVQLGKIDFYTSDVTGIGAHSIASIEVVAGGSNTASPDGEMVFSTGLYNAAATERMRIDSSGNVGIGTTSPATKLDVAGNIRVGATLTSGQVDFSTGTINGGTNFGDLRIHTDRFRLYNNAGTQIAYNVDSTGAPIWYTNGTERMRIDSAGAVLVGRTASGGGAKGIQLLNSGLGTFYVAADTCQIWDRLTNDGTIVDIRQGGVSEGTISVSGTTVSYNGGHLSRWAQLPDNSRPELLKGTVMSNLDQMSNWDGEDNEQLNCVEVSSVEGDANVAGVFVAWDSTDDDYNDILLAMTGDMIIRIGAGVTVQRGDLLMSAGDGTAKPQGDDIVRSKTIAKVTSTHVSHTYEDGSYAVPCVLMAC